MGLAASQARLLLLTARKSDLEYRAQMITNAQMMLAMQSEAIATKYNNKISNTAFYTNIPAEGDVSINNQMRALTGAELIELLDGENEYGYRFCKYNSETGKYEQMSEEGMKNEIANMTESELIALLNTNKYQVCIEKDGEWSPIGSGCTQFTESYYTDDDTAAEAEYKAETAKIQVKEKRLQLELQQVEAQQKACSTEIDAVKGVRDKNIEKTFKVFG